MRIATHLLLIAFLSLSLPCAAQVPPPEGTAAEPGVSADAEPGSPETAPLVEAPEPPPPTDPAALSADREEPRRPPLTAAPSQHSDPEAAPAEHDEEARAAGGFWLKTTLPLAMGALSSSYSDPAVTNYPSISLGGISSSGYGGGLGLTFSHLDVGRDPDTFVSLAPTFVYLHPGLADGAVRLGVSLAGLIGFADLGGDGGLMAGYLVSGNALFFPHPAFGVGIETGFHGIFLLEEEVSVHALYGGLTAMVIL